MTNIQELADLIAQKAEVKVAQGLHGAIRPIHTVFPDPKNARKHTEENIEAIALSLLKFGQVKPIVINAQGKILAGEGTYRAACRAGAIDIAAIVADHLSPEDQISYGLTDNKTTDMSFFDDLSVAHLIKEAQCLSAETSFPGFSPEEIDKYLEQLPVEPYDKGGPPKPKDSYSSPETPDFMPGKAPQRVQYGDIWQLGEHKLLCYDLMAEDGRLIEFMGSDLPAMVFADPPYGINLKNSWNPKNKKKAGKNFGKIANDEQILGFIPKILPFLAKNCSIYTCAGHQTDHLWRVLLDKYLKYKSKIVWDKGEHGNGDLAGAYGNRYELIFFHQLGRCLLKNGRDVDIWPIPRIQVEVHPTQKPAALPARAIQNSSEIKDVILDPFAGSGPTLIACQSLDRRALLVELEPAYCDWMVYWFENETKTDAQLISRME